MHKTSKMLLFDAYYADKQTNKQKKRVQNIFSNF